MQDSERYDEETLARKVRTMEGNNIVDREADSYLERLSNDVETQTRLLYGMIEYRRRNGVYPFTNFLSVCNI